MPLALQLSGVPKLAGSPLNPSSRAPADRENLRLTQQQFEALPLALLAQLAAAVAVCALGGLQVSGTFRPIRISDAPK